MPLSEVTTRRISDHIEDHLEVYQATTEPTSELGGHNYRLNREPAPSAITQNLQRIKEQDQEQPGCLSGIKRFFQLAHKKISQAFSHLFKSKSKSYTPANAESTNPSQKVAVEKYTAQPKHNPALSAHNRAGKSPYPEFSQGSWNSAIKALTKEQLIRKFEFNQGSIIDPISPFLSRLPKYQDYLKGLCNGISILTAISDTYGHKGEACLEMLKKAVGNTGLKETLGLTDIVNWLRGKLNGPVNFEQLSRFGIDQKTLEMLLDFHDIQQNQDISDSEYRRKLANALTPTGIRLSNMSLRSNLNYFFNQVQMAETRAKYTEKDHSFIFRIKEHTMAISFNAKTKTYTVTDPNHGRVTLANRAALEQFLKHPMGSQNPEETFVSFVMLEAKNPKLIPSWCKKL